MCESNSLSQLPSPQRETDLQVLMVLQQWKSLWYFKSALFFPRQQMTPELRTSNLWLILKLAWSDPSPAECLCSKLYFPSLSPQLSSETLWNALNRAWIDDIAFSKTLGRSSYSILVESSDHFGIPTPSFRTWSYWLGKSCFGMLMWSQLPLILNPWWL